MKITSKIQPQPVEKLQGGTLISFNVTETQEGFEYYQVKVSEEPIYSEIVEAIIATEYSIGRELAMINNNDYESYDTYQEFREMAKKIAKEIIGV